MKIALDTKIKLKNPCQVLPLKPLVQKNVCDLCVRKSTSFKFVFLKYYG